MMVPLPQSLPDPPPHLDLPTQKQKNKKQKNNRTKKKKKKYQNKTKVYKNTTEFILCWLNTPGHRACCVMQLTHPVTLHRRAAFPFVSSVNSFLVMGESLCPHPSLPGPHLCRPCVCCTVSSVCMHISTAVCVLTAFLPPLQQRCLILDGRSLVKTSHLPLSVAKVSPPLLLSSCGSPC